ncbi:MAG: hypothetical protein KVP17_004084 [Porospora cf. gigantea B]|uniref:uncharacterized protein n=1 Tax=Porospora cf. gigantea B TaxID=2853592 RepID=UPI003571987B|nr:MAG: hypothetical protein KVP17_004084 [Porospora cf. gigantea B]
MAFLFKVADKDAGGSTPLTVSSVPETVEDVSFSVEGETLVVLSKVVKSHAFQQSTLGVMSKDDMAIKDADGNLVLENATASEFRLLLRLLQEEDPLANMCLSDVMESFCCLYHQLQRFRLPLRRLQLPTRIIFPMGWTELASLHYLPSSLRNRFLLRPQAVQLPEGKVHAVKVLTEVEPMAVLTQHFAEDDDTLASACAAYVTTLGALKMSLLLCRNVLNTDCRSFDWFYLMVEVPPEDVSHVSVVTSTRDPHLVLFYSLLKAEPLPSQADGVPGCEVPVFPHVYKKKNNRLFVRFSSELAFELYNSKFSDSSSCKDLKTPGFKLRMVPSYHVILDHPLSETERKAIAVRPQWRCFHPSALSVKYRSDAKWLKDFGDVESVRFYTWGALIVLTRVDSPFAIISIDDADLQAIYGQRVNVYFRTSSAIYPDRSQMEVVVDANLANCYLIVNGSIISQPIKPMTGRIDFVVSDPNGNDSFFSTKPSVRTHTVEIGEGAPRGCHCHGALALGCVAVFDTTTTMYFQSKEAGLLVDKFNVLSKLDGVN